MSVKITYGAKQTGEIVSLAQAKSNSRIEYDTEDDLLQLFLDSATDEIENYLNAPVIKRTDSTIKLSEFKSIYRLNLEANVTALHYIDTDGNENQIATSQWEYEDRWLEILIDRPAKFKELKITADLGWDVANIPKDIKRAALLLFSHSENYRESVNLKDNSSAYNLLRQYRLIW